ncbi:hypothetical protein LSUB1_G003498 [Lachnellula subtilissima]|uniref:Mtf2-like C-terminal domain-containing protein n=1 Tax=Lachnellula subtilissima TaxID=602034 RepID=A0A8H8RUD6_9HELO|nr:hypothetical protein LSUB1_G003498 [Lachnellula subtilissima]
MTPFLYQTKTLSNLRWVGRNSPGWGRDNSDNRGDRIRPAPARGFIKRPPNPQPRASKNAEFEIPFEFEELHKSGPKKGNESAIKLNRWDTVKVNEFGESDDSELKGMYGNEFEGDDGSMYPVDGEGGPSMNLRGPRESTITETERRAFQKIFSDMFAQNQSLSPRPSQESKDQARLKLDSILGSAISKIPKSREERLRIVNSYPPALRPAAAKAMQLSSGDEEDLFEGEMEELEDLNHDQLETMRNPERERVESLMKEARTDFDLWAVMEKEVFALIPKLGLEEHPLGAGQITDAASLAKSKAKMRPKRKKAEIASEEREADKVQRFDRVVAQSPHGTEVSALTLYGPLYPSYLLFGIRLLDRSFAKPSPLALSVLPKIKSLGAISHVLGASTQLYNEILRIYYYGYEDFPSVARTLNEMERSAVDLDEETLGVVKDILIMRSRVSRGERGDVIKQLWGMPHFSRVNFQYWQDKIEKDIHIRTYPYKGEGQPMPVMR